MQQLQLDFSRPRFLEDEKKSELVSFRIGRKLKDELEAILRIKKVDSLSELCLEYIIKGYLEDYKQVLLLDVNGKKTLSELLGKG